MDLIDKQNIVRFEVGEHRGEIARLLQHRAGGGTQIHPHFIGDDIGQGGFPTLAGQKSAGDRGRRRAASPPG